MSSDLKAGAMFAGIGGFCRGFARQGIPTAWAIEKDPASVATYNMNIDHANVLMTDNEPTPIEKVSAGDLEPVDVLHAGFPCQSFSIAGERKGFDDPRGRLFFEVTRIISEFKDKKPSVLVLENSDNLKSGDWGRWFIDITLEIKRAGYWFRDSNSAVLDPYDLTDLPQRRRRLFMVAFSIDRFRNGHFSFPSVRSDQKKDLSAFIDFDGAGIGDSYYLPEDNRYYKMIMNEIDDKDRIYQLRKYVVRKKEAGVCPTLTANMGQGGHNVPFILDSRGIRKLTEYECLALQGFTDFNFPEEVPKPKRYSQVGNAVAVPVVELLAEKIKSKIVGERK